MPNNDPVILPETFNDPVTVNPSGNLTKPETDWAYEDVSAKDADTAFVAQLLVPNNDPVMLPDTFNDPVTSNPSGKLTNPATDSANDDVTAYEEETGVNVMLVAADAVVAKDDDIAFVAQLLVPNNDPVMLPDTLSEPVITNPFSNRADPLK